MNGGSKAKDASSKYIHFYRIKIADECLKKIVTQKYEMKQQACNASVYIMLFKEAEREGGLVSKRMNK